MAAPEQGDLGLLDDAAAQKLLVATVPAHLAYAWRDGTPRNTPIWFHWDGRAVVMCSPSNAPKVKVLTQGDPVAVTIHGGLALRRAPLARDDRRRPHRRYASVA